MILAALAAGCNGLEPWTPDDVRTEVPEPIDLLLPQEVRLHPFTGTRMFDAAGGVSGIDVRVEAIDAYGDASKAFGEFRFELYTFDASRPGHRGRQMDVWTVSVDDPKDNRAHWNSISHTYQFKLSWRTPIPVGQKFVLRAIFQSRFTDRLFDEREFVSGQ